jgi:hypothetical protein
MPAPVPPSTSMAVSFSRLNSGRILNQIVDSTTGGSLDREMGAHPQRSPQVVANAESRSRSAILSLSRSDSSFQFLKDRYCWLTTALCHTYVTLSTDLSLIMQLHWKRQAGKKNCVPSSRKKSAIISSPAVFTPFRRFCPSINL